MTYIVSMNSYKFEVRPGETILDAATRSSFPLPYSCRTGRCSTCKCRQLTGQSAALCEESGLSEAEKAAGWILGCARTATSPLELEVDAVGMVNLPPVVTRPCRIHSIENLTDDVLRIMLRLPPGSPFSYFPGQYIDVIAQGGVRRSYSVANADAKNTLLELHVRMVKSGVMSEYWFDRAQPNDLLRLNGPLGTFFLRDTESRDLVFLATGTGIAPVKAMLEDLRNGAPQARPRSVTVYWGGRIPADIYLDVSELGCRFVPVLSQAGTAWSGRRGHVQDVFLADKPNLDRTIVYACGSNAMISSARMHLMAAGLSSASFFSDAFVCSAATNIIERTN